MKWFRRKDTGAITEEFKKKLTEEIKRQLLEELDPHKAWKVNWRTVTKDNDDTNWVRKEQVAKSFETWERNSLARSGIEYLVVYILGKGLEYTCEHDKVKEAIDKFWKENKMVDLQYPLVRTRFLDGENFLWFPFEEGKKKLELGQIPLIIPIDTNEISYIAREEDNALDVWYYHRHFKVTKYPDIDENAQQVVHAETYQDKNIPAEEMLHFKRSELINMSRGRGILNTALEDLDEFKGWLKVRVVWNKVKALLAWWLKIPSTNQTEIDAWQARFDNFATYDKDGNRLSTIPTGQPIVTGKDMELQALSPNVGASGSVEDGRQIKLAIAVALGLPEFVLSDGQNANLATTTSQQSPLVKRMEAEQEQVRLMFKDIIDKALQMMIDSGDLDETYEIEIQKEDGTTEKVSKTPQELYDLIFPEIAITDIATLAQPLGILVDKKILSPQTATTLTGYDPIQEQERIKEAEELGYYKVINPSPFPFTAQETIPKKDLKMITKLRDACLKELRENYEQYREDLTQGLPRAKDRFVTNHQLIVKKYLEEGAKEGYANQVFSTLK